MIEIIKIIKNGFIFIGVIFLWEIASKYVNPIFIPSPKTVVADFGIVILNGQLWKAICYSFLRIAAATVLSGVIAIPMGLLIYNSKLAKDVLYPIISVMRYLPVTAFYPLLIMWFGIDELMKIIFLFIAAFVYMMPSVMLALDEVNPDLVDTGLTIGMSKIQTVTHIQLPASLPGIMNSFVMMFGIGWTYIAIAETINAKYGLGYIIQQSSARGRTDLVFMAIIAIMFISIVFDNASKKIIKKIFKWRYLKAND